MKDLATQISNALNEYKDVTVEAMHKAVDTATKEALQELHSANPSGAGKYGSWSAYNNGWTTEKEGKDTIYKKTIHNKTHYQLAHLLENGHALQNGGRSQAFPHIAPVEEKAIETVEDMIIKGIQG